MIWLVIGLVVSIPVIAFLSALITYRLLSDLIADCAVDHLDCVDRVTHYIGDRFAALVLEAAARDWDDPGLRHKIDDVIRTQYKDEGPSVIYLWMMERARELSLPTQKNRDTLADLLTEQAKQRFADHGPEDERGAAFWDVATALREDRL